MAENERPSVKKPDQKQQSNLEVPSRPKQKKNGCGSSFIMEERGELDKLCGDSKLDDEYEQSDSEKEAGGEG